MPPAPTASRARGGARSGRPRAPRRPTRRARGRPARAARSDARRPGPRRSPTAGPFASPSQPSMMPPLPPLPPPPPPPPPPPDGALGAGRVLGAGARRGAGSAAGPPCAGPAAPAPARAARAPRRGPPPPRRARGMGATTGRGGGVAATRAVRHRVGDREARRRPRRANPSDAGRRSFARLPWRVRAGPQAAVDALEVPAHDVVADVARRSTCALVTKISMRGAGRQRAPAQQREGHDPGRARLVARAARAGSAPRPSRPWSPRR